MSNTPTPSCGILIRSRLSREEREAAYNRARERIFGKEDKSGDGMHTHLACLIQANSSADVGDSNEMSRSSSISTKDRAAPGKKTKPKQRRDDSDTFDVRSQYAPIFQQPQVHGPTWAPANQYATPHQGYTMPGQLAYSNQQAQYVQSPQYNPAMMQNNGMQPYSSMVPQVRHCLLPRQCEFF